MAQNRPFDFHVVSQLSESAHIGRVLTSGPYRGLYQDESAIEVATVVHEQYNALEKLKARGELRDGMPTTLTSELRRRGFYAPGVRGAISAGWNRHIAAEKQYNESFLDLSSTCRRSDLTTANSMKLYSSFFAPDMELTTPDLTFMLGAKQSVNPSKRDLNGVDIPNGTSSFVARAAKLGYHIPSHSDLIKSRVPPLFPSKRRSTVPAGFEMINEDMFARKDNKFMVFNGAGIDSWNGKAPVTKASGLESMLLGTLG